MLWLLWIMLQWTLVCTYFFRTAISVPLILFILFVLGVFWVFSWLHCAAYGILVSWPGIELWSTAGKAPSLWITRKFTSLFPLSLISFEHMFSRRFANTLVTWCKQFTHWKRPRCWGRLRGGGEGGDRGRDGWIVMPMTQWIWPWANSGRQRGTGRPGVLQSMGLQRVGHDWLTEQQERVCWTTRLSFLIFWGLSMQFSIRAEPVYITTKRTQNFHMGSWDASRWKIPQTREGFFSLFHMSGNLSPLREGGWFEWWSLTLGWWAEKLGWRIQDSLYARFCYSLLSESFPVSRQFTAHPISESVELRPLHTARENPK